MATLLIPGHIIDEPTEVPIKFITKTIRLMRVSPQKVLVLKSSTGSGKSTILPVHIYNEVKNKITLSIQPRVFNTMSISKYISKEFKMPMGKTVGYYNGSFYRVPESGILLMTSGSFMQSIINDNDDAICNKYNTIIIDEAHEVEIMGNNIHLFLRNFIERCKNRIDCPIVIITSATFDSARFIKYYNAKYIEVTGISYPITNHFLEYASTDYIKSIIDIIINIHLVKNITEIKDILIFLPGHNEMSAFAKRWQQSAGYFSIDDILVLILNSDVVTRHDENYINLFKSSKELGVKRKIILSTNVGETGITYPNLGYIIDTGFYKTQDYIYDYNIYFNTNKSVSSYNVLQRMGRVGRTEAGDYYAIYTREVYDKLSAISNNHIYKDDLSTSVLQLLSLSQTEKTNTDIFNELLYQPAIHASWRAIEKLYLLGFIGSNMQLTSMGKIANNIGIFSVEGLKIILAGYIWGVSIIDLIIVVYAIQNSLPVVESEFSFEAQCDFMPAIENFYKYGAEGIFADHYDTFMTLRDSVIDSLAVAGLNPYENYDKSYPGDESYIKSIKQCIYEGLKINSAWWEGASYKTVTGIEIFEKFPCHINNFVYSSLILSKKSNKTTHYIRGKSIMDGFVNFTYDFF